MVVFIGTREAAYPCQRRLHPRVPGLSTEYSHRGRLQIVIKVNLITNTALIALVLAGPTTMGRIPHGPLLAATTREARRLRQGLRLATRERRIPHRSSSGRRLRLVLTCFVNMAFVCAIRRRSHRAKGSVFTFAPTKIVVTFC
jgi:hypothetical protein